MLKILVRNDQNLVEIPVKSIIRMIQQIFKKMDFNSKELSIVFVNDEVIQRINRKYLQRDKPTNVISFSYENDSEQDYPAFDNPLMGEVVVSAETCARNAGLAGMEPLDEIVFCLIHGLAHLLGYEHENVDSAITQKMESFEKDLYREFSNIVLGS